MYLNYIYIKKYDPFFVDSVKKGEITSIDSYNDRDYKVGDYVCIRAYDRGFCSEKVFLEVVSVQKKENGDFDLGIKVESDDSKAVNKVLFRQNGPLAANYVEVC